MKLTAKNTEGKNVIVKDVMGKPIHGVNSFDTKTCVAELFIRAGESYAIKKVRNKGAVVKVTVKIPGAYAEIDGERVK
jgi:hypothetical protein